MGVFPGRDTRCVESGCSPGETGCAQKTGVPRTKVMIVYWTIIV